ncbi:hypothetical protein BISA_1390 [Bifidobacterium saguini DSM 23967]|uniref:Uncharacterized protein n=1 Tax=Bifidobacterium saguini DSM 23967 TaxID=1437607 RepID=A0A087DCH4_9BIFI|nr:hypothetical protein [Bifidobacterium saguini]KFI93224.1 hypothetical protein BISA_1390 [Bifidobacterium saguini DSM 23967]
MTDTELSQNAGDETQLLQPIKEYKVPTVPLNLPKGGFGGYRAEPVEELVAQLRRQLDNEKQRVLQLKKENYALSTEKGRLNQRITALTDENKTLKYAAENPYERIGVDMQDMVNSAKNERKNMLDQAREQAEEILAEANGQKKTIVETAHKEAAAAIAESVARKQRIDHDADQRIGESKDKAERVIAEASAKADAILSEAKEKAETLDADSKARCEAADRRESEVAATVTQAHRMLAEAASRLVQPAPMIVTIHGKTETDDDEETVEDEQ